MKNKAYSPEKNAGIWLDQERAYIFKLNDNFKYELQTIQSGQDQNHQEHESRKHSNLKRMYTSREKIQRRQHQQMLKFFDTIVHEIRDVKYLYLFGPGNSKHELNKFIEKAGKKFGFKVMAIDAADKKTEPQMLEQVKNYFGSLSFEDSQRQLLSSE